MFLVCELVAIFSASAFYCAIRRAEPNGFRCSQEKDMKS